MDGAELLRRYRARPRARARVVVISGVTNADRLAKEVAADEFIGKPFDIDQLQRSVRRLVHAHATS